MRRMFSLFVCFTLFACSSESYENVDKDNTISHKESNNYDNNYMKDPIDCTYVVKNIKNHKFDVNINVPTYCRSITIKEVSIDEQKFEQFEDQIINQDDVINDVKNINDVKTFVGEMNEGI